MVNKGNYLNIKAIDAEANIGETFHYYLEFTERKIYQYQAYKEITGINEKGLTRK